MAVENSLTCHFANINSDVKAFHLRVSSSDIVAQQTHETLYIACLDLTEIEVKWTPVLGPAVKV